MKLFLCSDLAGKIPAVSRDVIAGCQLHLIAGDLTLGAKNQEIAAKTFVKLADLFPSSCNVYYIPGNHDFAYLAEAHPWIPKNYISMHDQVKEIHLPTLPKPIVMVGFGGAKVGLYNNFAFTEEEIFQHLDLLFGKIAIPAKDRFTILLIHDPPINSKLDLTFMRTHVGSESVRKIIEKWQPDLAVAGHIHESPGVDFIGRTLAVNAGEAKHNHYAIIEFTDEKKDVTLF